MRPKTHQAFLDYRERALYFLRGGAEALTREAFVVAYERYEELSEAPGSADDAAIAGEIRELRALLLLD